MTDPGRLQDALDRAHEGGPERHRVKSAEQGKLPVRERVALLLDEGSFVEDALLANWEQEGLGADGVVTGLGEVAGRPVAVMANDPSVKAGSWGPKTVEKIIRIQERALESRIPMIYLVDSAGGRVTHPGQMFPGGPGGRRIFFTAGGGGADHRPGADVPGAPGRRADLLHRGAHERRGAAALRAVRAQRRGRRLHPRLLRHRDHA